MTTDTDRITAEDKMIAKLHARVEALAIMVRDSTTYAQRFDRLHALAAAANQLAIYARGATR